MQEAAISTRRAVAAAGVSIYLARRLAHASGRRGFTLADYRPAGPGHLTRYGLPADDAENAVDDTLGDVIDGMAVHSRADRILKALAGVSRIVAIGVDDTVSIRATLKPGTPPATAGPAAFIFVNVQAIAADVAERLQGLQ